MNQQEIIDTLKYIKPDLKKNYPLIELGIFGSTARGDFNDESDVDVVVVTKYPDLFDLIGIKQDIEEKLNRKVDVVRLRPSMNKFLKKRIEKEAIYV